MVPHFKCMPSYDDIMISTSHSSIQYPTDPLILDVKQFRILIRICREIRLLRSFHAMGHCGKFLYELWAITVNLVVRYRPLRRIWLYTMGHCGGFGYAPWATARNEALQYKSEVISALWAIAQDLVMPYGLWRRVCLSAMGHSEGFG
jgi:hypothetical protein